MPTPSISAALTLNFNDTSLGNQAGGQDSNTLFLFYDNAVSGTTFSTLTTDLAAGYETEAPNDCVEQRYECANHLGCGF